MNHQPDAPARPGIIEKLAVEVETALCDLTLKYVDAYARLYPEVGACWAEVADSYVCFAGTSSPLSRATGLGLRSIVTEDAIRAAEDFLTRRGAAPMVDSSPFRDESLLRELKHRGYEVDHLLSLYCLMVDGPNPCQQMARASRGVTVTRLDQTDACEEKTWVLTVAHGFAGSNADEPQYMDIYRTMFHAQGTIPFLARVDGVAAGGGVLKISQKVGVLSTASTIPAFRRMGVQSALLASRLEAAWQAGCDIAAIQATPGSDSERNIVRAGFSLAYTMADFVRRPGQPD